MVENASQAVFVGRSVELDGLRAAVDAARDGHGRCVLISGEPGIGKTRVAEALAAHAEEQGMQVAWGSCYEGEGAPPFWPWAQLLRQCTRRWSIERWRQVLGAAVADVASLVPALGAGAGDAVGSGESPDARFRLFESVARVLEDAGREQPLLVVIDDLHGADRPSLLLLQFVVRELRDLPVLIVATHRDIAADSSHPLAHTFGELLRATRLQRLALRGLSAVEVGQYVEGVAGVTPNSALVSTLHRQTEGNPLFVSEFVRVLLQEHGAAALAEGGEALALAVPPTVRTVIGQRLTPLSAQCRQLLTLASVVGREFRRDVVAHAWQSPAAGQPPTLAAAMDEARAAGVINDVPGALEHCRFAHALIRETLYEGLDGGTRVTLHRRVGEAIEAMPSRANLDAELAYHFFEAGRAGDNDKAVRYARAAGDRALAMLAFEEAERSYAMAIEAQGRGAPVDAALQCDLLLALGGAQNASNDRIRARVTFRAAAELARGLFRTGATRPRAVRLAQAALGFSGGWIGLNEVARFDPSRPASFDPESANLIEAALAALGADDHPLRARLLGRLAAEKYHVESVAASDALSQEAIAVARRVGDAATLADVLALRHVASWRPDNAAERLAMATELAQLGELAGDALLLAAGHGWRVVDLLELADVEAAQRESALFAAAAERARQPFLRWAVTIHESMWALLQGRFADCERLAVAARAHGRRGNPSALLFYGLQITALRREQGRSEELTAMSHFLKGAVDQYPAMPSLRTQLAFLYSEIGQPEAARSELAYVGAQGFADVPQNLVWLMALAEAAEACAAVGDAPHAEALYRLLEPYAAHNVVGMGGTVCWGSTARTLGLLACTCADWDAAETHFETGLAANRRLGSRVWVAHTQHAYGSMLLARRRSGDAERARYLLDQALLTADTLGMPTLAGRVRSALQGEPAAAAERRRSPAPVVPADPHSSDSPAVAATSGNNLLRYEGDFWTISFDGQVSRLRDTRGVRFLARLLQQPGRELHVLDLAAGAAAADEPAGLERAVAAQAGLVALDARAKADYRRRIDCLRAELEEAESFHDLARAQGLRDELELIAGELAAAVGLGGRDRRTGSNLERARLAVTKRIRDVIKKVRGPHPRLAHHLESCVKTGYYCVYRPDPDRSFVWQVEAGTAIDPREA